MGFLWFIAIILAIIHFVLAIKLPWFVSLMIVLGWFIYINSNYVRRKEIVGLIDVGLMAWSIIGLVVGNVYYLIFFADPRFDLGNAMKWLFTP